MNTINNKTSLYELVTKRDRLKVMDEVEDVKDKLDTIPRGEILTAYNQFGEVSKIFIYNSKAVGSDCFNTLLTCYPYACQLTKNHTFNLNDIDKLSFATSLQKEILFEQMMKEGYIWNGQNVVKDESTEKEDEIVDGFPTEEETIVPSDKKKCIIDKAIEEKIVHNIKIANDIIGNTLPYYAISEDIDRIIRTPKNRLHEDLNNFNYFTNKEDVDEAIRRVRETLMNFQEEIQNKNK